MTLGTPLVTLLWESFRDGNADQDLNSLLVKSFGQDQGAIQPVKSVSMDIFAQCFPFAYSNCFRATKVNKCPSKLSE